MNASPPPLAAHRPAWTRSLQAPALTVPSGQSLFTVFTSSSQSLPSSPPPPHGPFSVASPHELLLVIPFLLIPAFSLGYSSPWCLDLPLQSLGADGLSLRSHLVPHGHDDSSLILHQRHGGGGECWRLCWSWMHSGLAWRCLSPVSPYIHKVGACLAVTTGWERGGGLQGGVCYQTQQQWESGPGGTWRSSAIAPAHSPGSKGGGWGVGHSPAQNPGEIGAQPCQEVIPCVQICTVPTCFRISNYLCHPCPLVPVTLGFPPRK